VLLETGDLSSAERCVADGLAQAQRAGDTHSQALCLGLMADMDQRAGRISEAGAHLRESLELATRMGDPKLTTSSTPTRIRNIIELYRAGDQWNYSLLVPGDGDSAPLPPLSTATPLAGYSTEFDESEHVIYLDDKGRVQELYRADNGWNVGETIA
jgi:hypothetical protein